jgi:hypothetical protein
MRMAGAWVGVVLAASSLQAQATEQGPTCRAERNGSALTTRIQYSDGYRVDAPWRITEDSRAGSTSIVRAVLDRVIEFEPLTSTQQITSLPSAIEVTFRGTSTVDLLEEAANVWCMTVMKARASHELSFGKRRGMAGLVEM